MSNMNNNNSESHVSSSPLHLHVPTSSPPRRKMSASARTLLQLPQLTRADGLAESTNLKVSPRVLLQQHQLHKVQDSLKELQKTTHFGALELRDLFSKYMARVSDNNGKMNKDLFTQCCQELLQLDQGDPLIEQYYKIFDSDEDGFIDFREFVTGASILLKGTPSEKIHFVFSIYDMNKNGTIEKSEMRHCLLSMFHKGVQMLQDVSKALGLPAQANMSNLTREDIIKQDLIDKIVDTCFAQAHGNDTTDQSSITEKEFTAWILSNEHVMKLLSPSIHV